jgi:hypothetical protein
MPRAPRIEHEDATYRVMARGNRRLPVVHSDAGRGIFAETLAEAAASTPRGKGRAPYPHGASH